MITREVLLLLKAKYLLNKELTDNEADYVLAYSGDGTRQDVRAYITKLGSTRKFKTLRDSVEPFILNVEKLSKDEMLELIYRVGVESASLDCGLRIIRNSENKDDKKVLVYLYNLYLRDVENFERDMNNRRKSKFGIIKEKFVYAPTIKVGISGDVDLPGMERAHNELEDFEWKQTGTARNVGDSMQPMEYSPDGKDRRTDEGPRARSTKKVKRKKQKVDALRPRFIYYQPPPVEPGPVAYGK